MRFSINTTKTDEAVLDGSFNLSFLCLLAIFLVLRQTSSVLSLFYGVPKNLRSPDWSELPPLLLCKKTEAGREEELNHTGPEGN